MAIKETDKPKRSGRYGSNIMVSLDKEMRDWIGEEAKREDRPIGQMARVLLKEAREARAAVQAK